MFSDHLREPLLRRLAWYERARAQNIAMACLSFLIGGMLVYGFAAQLEADYVVSLSVSVMGERQP